jgi:hypothetical protein
LVLGVLDVAVPSPKPEPMIVDVAAGLREPPFQAVPDAGAAELEARTDTGVVMPE